MVRRGEQRRDAPLRRAPTSLPVARPVALRRGADVTVTGHHEPALDGLRAAAVIAVIAFHGTVPSASGGFLGVSLFFTLSGFLITGLLLTEWAKRGSIAVLSFWIRRLRRLAPAALVCIAAVIAGVRPVGVRWDALRWDAVAALGNVANWRFVAARQSYAELFETPSPLQHFWSLAIEEQFYFMFPLIAVVTLRGNRGRARFAAIVGLLTALLLLVPLLFSWSRDRVYYGTDSRAIEILVGSLLAVIAPAMIRFRRVIACASSVAAGVVVAGFMVVEQSMSFLYRGGLPLYSLASAVLVLGCTVAGPVRAVLRATPLAYVGRISYGLYLYHWPILLWLSPERLGWSRWSAFLLAVVVTFAAAILSYHVLELPIRHRRLLVRPRTATASYGLAAVSLLAVCALVSPSSSGADAATPLTNNGPRLLTLRPSTESGATTPEGIEPSGTLPAPARRPRMLIVGSSRTEADAVRRSVADLEPEITEQIDPACPIYDATQLVTAFGTKAVACLGVEDTLQTSVAAAAPDVVVLVVGGMERSQFAQDDAAVADGISLMVRQRNELRRRIQLLASINVPAFVADELADLNDAVHQIIVEEVGRAEGVAVMSRDRVELRNATIAALLIPASQRRVRLLVVGDSTALYVADGLAVAAADQLDVVTAGEEGCPLVRTARVRQTDRLETSGLQCPDFAVDWPRFIETFRPDAILVVAGLSEQWDHQYPGLEGWHSPGGQIYDAYHRLEMSLMIDALAPSGTPMLVLDAPTVRRDNADRFTDATRTAAYNRIMAELDRTWSPLRIVPYADLLADPNSEAGYDERPDGVHPSRATVERITREALLDRILRAYDDVGIELKATGCASADGSRRQFVMARCAAER